MNRFNQLSIFGRLATDPDQRDNRDGSKKVYLKLYTTTNIRTSNGKTIEECVDLEAYVPKDIVGPYGNFHAGDYVYITATVRNVRYESAGQIKSRQFIQIETIDHLESKEKTDERLIRKDGKNAK